MGEFIGEGVSRNASPERRRAIVRHNALVTWGRNMGLCANAGHVARLLEAILNGDSLNGYAIGVFPSCHVEIGLPGRPLSADRQDKALKVYRSGRQPEKTAALFGLEYVRKVEPDDGGELLS